ncbi:MAG: leucine-rich repeat protein, partial [Ruminococcus sp.]|nr:leucine-rich repeat protein [Ruminococcus sp.]
MKFKKVLIMLLLLITAKPVFSYGESTAGNIDYNGMTFIPQGQRPDELILTEYTGDDENLVIPERIGDYIVTAVDDEVFKDNQNIKSITLPDTIYYFGAEVFRNSSLISVNIPKSLRVLPSYSFDSCSKLETVVFHDNIVLMDYTAFQKTDIEVPPELYDKVLEETYIATSNTSVALLNDEWGYTIVNNYGDAYVIIEFYRGNDTEVIIPDSINGVNVTKTGLGFQFPLNTSVKSISFPETITELNIKFFKYSELEEITLPDIDNISEDAFANCKNLRKINFQGNPETFTIGRNAFKNCTNIDFIPYPEGCNNINIGNNAFENTGIQEVIIDCDSTIDTDAFRNCQDLSYVELNNTHVNSRAFRNCSALEDVTVTGKSVLEEMSFCDCRMLKNITLSDFDIQMTNPVYNSPELMTINNRNAFDNTTGDFNKELKDFIFNSFNGVDEVGFINLYVQAQAQKITDEIISDDMSEVQKIRAVHDWVCNNTVYDYEQVYDLKNHNDASVLMNDSTVCVGYARIANILYNTAGIESYYISGIDHAWNVVRAGNNYFHVDTTWDDGDVISYDWFMKSDEEIKSDGNHAKWSADIPSSLHSFQQGKTLPECSYSMGDVNQDNNINIADMVVMNKCILCQDNTDYDSYILSDLNFDGVVNSFDLVKMRQLLIKSGSYSMGDVNQDNNIDIEDMVMLNKYILGQDNIDYDSYIL